MRKVLAAALCAALLLGAVPAMAISASAAETTAITAGAEETTVTASAEETTTVTASAEETTTVTASAEETTVTAGAEETTVTAGDTVLGNFTFNDIEFRYEVNGNGNATLCYFSSTNKDLTEPFELIIPEKVITDDHNELIVDEIRSSFAPSSALTKVSIPATVTKIGDNAFSSCSHLTTVTFADNSNLTQIGNYAFAYTGLTSITIPDKVTTLGSFNGENGEDIYSDCFTDCTALETVILPNTLQKIGSYCFSGCTKLSKVGLKDTPNKLPDSLTYLGAYAFWDCKALTEISIPGGVETILHDTFLFCTSLKKVNSENPAEGLKKIEESAFWGCTALEEIHLPSSTKEIADDLTTWGSFHNCNSDLTFYCYDNQYAVDYADRNGFQWVSIVHTGSSVVTTRSNRVTSSTDTSPTVTSPQTGAKSPVLGSMSLVVLGGAVAGFAGVISQKRKKED